MNIGKPNLEVFGETVLALGQQNKDLLIVTSDSRGSGKLVPFGEALPEQTIEVGIAEQNLVGVSAGLASAGKIVFAVSPACFLAARSLEQIKNDVAYADNKVNLIGISAGVSYGALGSTHHSLHDLAALQAINNIDIVVPADNFETKEVIKAAVTHPKPIFIRFGKKPMLHLHNEETKFEVGKAISLLEGKDLTFLAIGEPTSRALLACQQLAEKGISAGVISIHTLKPLDEATILAAARSTGAIITVEEHSVYGGLGTTVAALLMEHGVCLPFKMVGIPDEYTVTGSQFEIFEHYGITPEGLVEKAKALLRRKIVPGATLSH